MQFYVRPLFAMTLPTGESLVQRLLYNWLLISTLYSISGKFLTVFSQNDNFLLKKKNRFRIQLGGGAVQFLLNGYRTGTIKFYKSYYPPPSGNIGVLPPFLDSPVKYFSTYYRPFRTKHLPPPTDWRFTKQGGCLSRR